MNSLEALRISVERFVPLTEKEWQQFSMHWIPFSFDKGEIVTKVGQIEAYFTFINQGLMRGYFESDGTDYNVGFFMKGIIVVFMIHLLQNSLPTGVWKHWNLLMV